MKNKNDVSMKNRYIKGLLQWQALKKQQPQWRSPGGDYVMHNHTEENYAAL